MPWLMLAGAIALEVIATVTLRGTAEALRPLPVMVVIAGYLGSFTLMAMALRTLNVGVVYAIWSGVGTAGVAAAGALLYGERLNLTAIAGIALIVLGVVITASSGATTHG
ncbi:DMT family transporter [Thermostaphylospora chromogena]|uniref:Small multidrug resistance pump n=1 Tax=Thermostaphylospora chromogena TaxID=35622 RepID=A0A1H1CYK2_9ACTN|nr:SMR family transporter [Thermostaphylospora chromogena]SDQ69220.1 small multidrug resistance pump [Thermostaphylospora chromogena]